VGAPPIPQTRRVPDSINVLRDRDVTLPGGGGDRRPRGTRHHRVPRGLPPPGPPQVDRFHWGVRGRLRTFETTRRSSPPPWSGCPPPTNRRCAGTDAVAGVEQTTRSPIAGRAGDADSDVAQQESAQFRPTPESPPIPPAPGPGGGVTPGRARRRRGAGGAGM